MVFTGLELGIIEIGLFFITSFLIKYKIKNLSNMDTITYYWLSFTVLTMLWEIYFVLDYYNVISYATYLLQKHVKVWDLKYNLSAVPTFR